MIWARMLAYITGTVDQELLLRNEYLAEENRILRAHVKGRLLLSDAEKATLAEIAHRLGHKALAELASAAKPDTLFRWYRDLIAKKFDGSRFRKSRGRPPLDEEIERLVVRMARENPSWGYDRIVGAMANLGHQVSDQTVGNILKQHDLPPARKVFCEGILSILNICADCGTVKLLCRFPLIVVQQAPQSFSTPHCSQVPSCLQPRRKQDPIVFALMVALFVLMCAVLLQRSQQRRFSKQDQP